MRFEDEKSLLVAVAKKLKWLRCVWMDKCLEKVKFAFCSHFELEKIEIGSDIKIFTSNSKRMRFALTLKMFTLNLERFRFTLNLERFIFALTFKFQLSFVLCSFVEL